MVVYILIKFTLSENPLWLLGGELEQVNCYKHALNSKLSNHIIREKRIIIHILDQCGDASALFDGG